VARIHAAPIERVESAVYVIPTEQPESDGTLSWDHTTLVVVHVTAGGARGLGYTYSSGAAATVIDGMLAPAIVGSDALAIPRAWALMRAAVRNLGQPGIAFNAVSAVDAALWDLKAKLLQLPLVDLLGAARDSVPLYGSGGFTSYSESQLCEQLEGWAERGFRFVKMKIGRDAEADVQRVKAARRALQPQTQLFVDANGAYSRKRALLQAERFASHGVTWFEEPVSSDDLAGLRLLRDRAPAGMQIAAGEYGYTPNYFQRMLEAEAVDVLQADVTRCGGITGFMAVSALVTARSGELSGHCAPALHVHVACAVEPLCHLEYFHDHVRIEHMLFDGCPEPRGGTLAPDRGRPGLGLSLKHADAQRYAVNA
jgi:L-alanine-DL-glutamate epimerase-like enolase superfamily enzyme